jgi:hypothetical protein
VDVPGEGERHGRRLGGGRGRGSGAGHRGRRGAGCGSVVGRGCRSCSVRSDRAVVVRGGPRRRRQDRDRGRHDPRRDQRTAGAGAACPGGPARARGERRERLSAHSRGPRTRPGWHSAPAEPGDPCCVSGHIPAGSGAGTSTWLSPADQPSWSLLTSTSARADSPSRHFEGFRVPPLDTPRDACLAVGQQGGVRAARRAGARRRERRSGDDR